MIKFISTILWALIAILFLVLILPTMGELVSYWNSDQESSHGFLIPLISTYLVWTRKDQIKKLSGQESGTAYEGKVFFFILVSLCIFIIGKFSDLILFQGIALVLLLAGFVYLFFGKKLFNITIFPIMFLLFMLPIPNPAYYAIADPLKHFVAQVSSLILSILGVPAILEGNTIHLPDISLEVHETCSGIRTIISFLALGILIGFFNLNTFKSRILIIAFSLIIAVVINILRVTAIGVLSVCFDNDVAMSFHSNGWIFITPLGVFFILICGEMLRCQKSGKTN